MNEVEKNKLLDKLKETRKELMRKYPYAPSSLVSLDRVDWSALEKCITFERADDTIKEAAADLLLDMISKDQYLTPLFKVIIKYVPSRRQIAWKAWKRLTKSK